MDRRLFLSAAAAGAMALAVETASAPAAVAATTPRLPGEVSRIANVKTAAGKLYDNIEVSIAGDRARLFVPQGITATTVLGAVWFHHATGSTHNAMNQGYKYPAELVVDQGALAICINAGGTQYSNPFAQQAQINAWKYVDSIFRVRRNFLRSTSGGGPLAAYVYGTNLIPYLYGLYAVNALYDVEHQAARDTDEKYALAEAYNNDPALMARCNPANLPLSGWKGDRVKVLVSDAAHPDIYVEPEYNGLALINKIKSTATAATVRYHDLGHKTPTFAHKDMIATFAAWSR